MEIRLALPPDRDAVCDLLHERMDKRIPLTRWRGITDGRWAPDIPEFGVVAVEDGRIVGFLGVVYAQRQIGGVERRSGNLTSWYIEKPYRGSGLGLEMLRAALGRGDVTYTTFSSNPPALRLMEKAGLRLLDDRRLIWLPRPRQPTAGVEVLSGAKVLGRLSQDSRRIIADHQGFDLRSHVIAGPDATGCLVILHVKRKGPDIAYHEVLHVDDPAVLGRHVGNLADAILPAGDSLLSVDSRFLVEGPVPDRSEVIGVPRFYRPAGLAVSQVDFLYSEVVLLDLKLY